MRSLVIGLALTCAAGAASAETITLPAFAPALGKDIVYRVETETTVSIADKGTKTVRGDFHNTLVVNERLADGFRGRWRVDPQPPSQGSFESNDLYRQTIGVYGLTVVEIDTNARGQPVRLNDGGAIKRHMEDTIRRTFGTSPVAPGTVLDTMLKKIAADPMFPVRALVPALNLTTAMQSDKPREFEIGKVNTTTNVAGAFGDTAAATLSWSLASVDRNARTVTFTWSDEADPNGVAAAAKKYIDREVAAARLQHGTLSPLQLLELTSASTTRKGLARVSLDDGVTIYAEETVSQRLGPMRNETTVKVTREP